MIIKYKLGDLAKDLGMANKDVVTALGNHGADKKHTSVLSESELDFVFNSLTKQYSTESFEQYFVEGKATPTAAAPEPVRAGDAKTDEAFRRRAQQKAEEAATRKIKPQGEPAPQVKERVERVIDTRAAQVDIDKYNEK